MQNPVGWDLYVVGWWRNGNFVFFLHFFNSPIFSPLHLAFVLPYANGGNRQAASPSLWCFLSHLHPQTTFISKPSSTTIATGSLGCPINSSSSSAHHQHYHHAGLKFPPSEALGRLRRGKEGSPCPLNCCCWLHFLSLCIYILCLVLSHITHLTHLPDWQFYVINCVMLLLSILFSYVVF